MRSGRQEAWDWIRPSRQAKADCRRNGLSLEPLRVRLVRVELPSGETEVLITYLGNGIPRADFAELYHLLEPEDTLCSVAVADSSAAKAHRAARLRVNNLA